MDFPLLSFSFGKERNAKKKWEIQKKRKSKKKKMKQCTTGSSKESSLFTSATEDELLVCQILLDLEKMFMPAESCWKFVWGCTRRRSSLDVPPLSSALSSKSPVVQRTEDEIEVRRPQVKAEEEGPAATSSPATPLSFSPSESDEKSNHSSKKSSKKRSREEFMDMIEGLTRRGDLLRGEIENVRKYYNKLKAHNSELKAMKQKVLNSCPRKEESLMEMNRFMNLGMDFTPHYRITTTPHHQPYIADRVAQKFQNSFGPITTQVYSSNNGLESVNRVGPVGIPDLNLSTEEVDASHPLDVNIAIADKRARFAEARRLRRGIIKIKSMRSACGIKLPRTRF